MPFAKEGRPGAEDAGRRGAAAAAEEEAPPRGARAEGRGRAGRARAAQGGEPRGLRQARAAPRRAKRRRRRRGHRPAKRTRTDGQDVPARAPGARPRSTRPASTPAAAAAAAPRAVYRKFGLCRICLRELAHNGYIPGMTKSQLVASTHVDDRPHRRLPDADPQRDPGRPRDRRHPVVQAQGRDGPDPRASRATSTATRSRRPTRDHPGEIIRVRAEVHRATAARRSPACSASRARAGARTSAAASIPKVQGGMGTAIVSTSRGVMTGHEARKRGRRRRGRGGGLVAAHVPHRQASPSPSPTASPSSIEPELVRVNGPTRRALRAHPARHHRRAGGRASSSSRARPTAASTAPCTA